MVLGPSRSRPGAAGTHWDGVKNHTAKLNLMAMKLGEQVFFYHSNEGLEIVGIVEVIKEAYNWIPGEPWVAGRLQGGEAAAAGR